MKVERIISIIMLLLERKQMSAGALSEIFEVSRRTIYRDMEVINAAGIPIVSFAGSDGGFSIMEQYKIDKKLFTIADVTLLLTALGSVHASLSSIELINTLAKVKGLIPEEHLKDIERKSNQVSIDYTPWFGNRNTNNNLEIIKNAINDQKYLEFQYSDQKGKKSKRKVEPYQLILKDSNWYLIAYCTDREDFRIFKVLRILTPGITEHFFEIRELPDRLLHSLEAGRKEMITIKLLIDKSIYSQMLEIVDESSMEIAGEDKYLVQYPFIEDDYGYGLLLKYGDKCECLEPQFVREELLKRLESIANLYKKSLGMSGTDNINDIILNNVDGL